MTTISRILAGALLAGCLLSPPAFAQTATCANPGTVKPVASNDHSVKDENYPLLSRSLKEEGTVVLKFNVKEDGSVDDLQVATSSGFPRLDEAALELVKNWRYSPGTQNCKPVVTAWTASLNWKLAGPAPSASVQAVADKLNTVAAAPADYPAGARDRHEEGTTVLLVMFVPTMAQPVILVVTSSGSKELDQAAVQIATARVHMKAADYAGQQLVSFMPLQVLWRLPPKP